MLKAVSAAALAVSLMGAPALSALVVVALALLAR